MVPNFLKPFLASVTKPIANSKRTTDLFLKAATYPRFARWTKDHPADKSVNGLYTQRNLFHGALLEIESLTDRITYLEFGVYEGKSFRWWAEHNKDPGSRFVGFDSFEGLPEEWTKDRQQGKFSVGGSTPDIDDRRCSFQVGWFHVTLPPFLGSFERTGRLVVHLDADLYRSTLLVLAHLGPILKPADVLIFDEFSDSIHEFRAFEDYAAIFQPGYTVVTEMNNYARVAIRIDD